MQDQNKIVQDICYRLIHAEYAEGGRIGYAAGSDLMSFL